MSCERHECRASGALRRLQRGLARAFGRWHGQCSSSIMPCVCAIMCVIASACVLPPPIDEATPDANRAPVVDPVLPTRDGEPVQLKCDNSPTTFLANISDQDAADTLYYRFFIDYYRLLDADRLSTTVTKVPPARDGARIAETDISANNAILAEHPTDVHVIELLVADRAFDDSNPNVSEGEIARVPVEGGLTASYQWAVNPIVCN